MTIVTSEAHIDAPPEQVWATLADLRSIYKWNPGVEKSYTTGDQPQGEGATRHCDLQGGGNYLEERAFDWREGEGFKIDVYQSNLPLKRNVVTFAVAPDGAGTHATVIADYQLKYGPIGALMDIAFGRRQAQQGFEEMMAGLKHHIETGELVGEMVPAAS